jgi:hypothetical protein
MRYCCVCMPKCTGEAENATFVWHYRSIRSCLYFMRMEYTQLLHCTNVYINHTTEKHLQRIRSTVCNCMTKFVFIDDDNLDTTKKSRLVFRVAYYGCDCSHNVLGCWIYIQFCQWFKLLVRYFVKYCALVLPNIDSHTAKMHSHVTVPGFPRAWYIADAMSRTLKFQKHTWCYRRGWYW